MKIIASLVTDFATNDVPNCVTVVECAGVEFIDENGGGPGVRLRKRQQAKRTK